MATPTIQPFDFSVDVLAAALWQHSSAPNILGLLNAKQSWYDDNQESFWNDFYTNIFDLKTANSFGLSVWSIILGAPIVYNVIVGDQPSWAFGEYHGNFNNSNFSANNGIVVNYPLSEETARVILQLRYYQLTGTCTAPSINRMLASIFENYGKAYIVDGLDMNQLYVFTFPVPADMQFAFNNFDVLPRPAGVGSAWSPLIQPLFGFNINATNFDHGNFSAG